MNSIGGIPIYVNALCVKLKVWYTIESNPIPKRRRRWRVRRNELSEPCVFKTPGGIYMHPVLYEQLRQLNGGTK